jgi:hypothetical protein
LAQPPAAPQLRSTRVIPMESSVFIPSLRFLVASNAIATGPLNVVG